MARLKRKRSKRNIMLIAKGRWNIARGFIVKKIVPQSPPYSPTPANRHHNYTPVLQIIETRLRLIDFRIEIELSLGLARMARRPPQRNGSHPTGGIMMASWNFFFRGPLLTYAVVCHLSWDLPSHIEKTHRS